MKAPLRSIVVVAASVAANGAVVLVACGSPSSARQDESDAGREPSDGMSDAFFADVQVSEAVEPDAQIAVDAGQKVDAAGCTTCDCDGDHFDDFSKFGCVPPAGVDAGVGDCDDTDPRIRPDQEYYFQDKNPPRSGDWNCDGMLERYYKNTGVTCGVAVSVCAKTGGFQHNPACGESDTYVFCRTTGWPLPLGCEVDPTRSESRIQACK